MKQDQFNLERRRKIGNRRIGPAVLCVFVLFATMYWWHCAQERKGRATGTGNVMDLTLLDGVARRNNHGIVVKCTAALINSSDASIVVLTPFGSPFDALELLMEETDGKVIVVARGDTHLSPARAAPMEVLIRPGMTRGTATFLLSELPAEQSNLIVRLRGNLEHGSWREVVLSHQRTILVQKEES